MTGLVNFPSMVGEAAANEMLEEKRCSTTTSDTEETRASSEASSDDDRPLTRTMTSSSTSSEGSQKQVFELPKTRVPLKSTAALFQPGKAAPGESHMEGSLKGAIKEAFGDFMHELHMVNMAVFTSVQLTLTWPESWENRVEAMQVLFHTLSQLSCVELATPSMDNAFMQLRCCDYEVEKPCWEFMHMGCCPRPQCRWAHPQAESFVIGLFLQMDTRCAPPPPQLYPLPTKAAAPKLRTPLKSTKTKEVRDEPRRARWMPQRERIAPEATEKPIVKATEKPTVKVAAPAVVAAPKVPLSPSAKPVNTSSIPPQRAWADLEDDDDEEDFSAWKF